MNTRRGALIRRARHLADIERTLEHSPVCALLGPRQCGKTTLAQAVVRGRKHAHLFDLETAAGRARLAEPELSLSPLAGLVVIDEIQRQPGLFEVLRPLADRSRTRASSRVVARPIGRTRRLTR
jgi:predicted AAA+ superfamily ATPase